MSRETGVSYHNEKKYSVVETPCLGFSIAFPAQFSRRIRPPRLTAHGFGSSWHSITTGKEMKPEPNQTPERNEASRPFSMFVLLFIESPFAGLVAQL